MTYVIHLIWVFLSRERSCFNIRAQADQAGAIGLEKANLIGANIKGYLSDQILVIQNIDTPLNAMGISLSALR